VAHARFFRETFELDPAAVEVALVGAEDRLFRPGWQPPEPFLALFVGKLIPLHGLDTILDAARLAPEIPFRIVGEGQLADALTDAPANVERVGWVEYEALPELYQRAGCALGIFGTGEKAGRVIPNKVFQALACGRPLVTADTPGARELLTDGHDALLVSPGDPAQLAAALRRLAADPALAERIALAGHATYEDRASEAVLGVVWRSILERALR
jgi:glycosyltransferase involved in cell wall biosynthesis